MITENLYDKVLVEPARDGGDTLNIVSGYAGAAFAADHMEDMIAIPNFRKVCLIVGMFPNNGPLRSNHAIFQELSTTGYPLGFECRYVVTSPPVHVKAYVWHKQGQPLRGFVGSVNYGNKGFRQQRESVAVADAQEVQNYFDALWDTALDCREAKADELVAKAVAAYKSKPSQAVLEEEEYVEGDLAGLPHVRLSLLARNGDIHKAGAGLNWGQSAITRSGKLRKRTRPDEAYIPVSAATARKGFFPPLKHHFTLNTDDGKPLLCVPAQPKAGGGTDPQAIETPKNNSLLGTYFRNRLGLAAGAPVTKQDLLNYGRTDVVIYKIDDDEYYMDFSKP